MTSSDIEKMLTRSINMCLSVENESVYSNSFRIQLHRDGFEFIPNMPCSYVLNSDLYFKIFEIASGVLYPEFTLLKEMGAVFKPRFESSLNERRSFRYRWLIGIPQRLELSTFENQAKSTKIKIMKNFDFDFEKVTHIAIAGNSGSGKSYFLKYLLEQLKPISELIIIDPKLDEPTRWAIKNNVKYIVPVGNSTNDYVSSVNDVLKNAVDLIQKRQKVLLENENVKFKHFTIVIDELLALSMTAQKKLGADFATLLAQIALLGRATKVHLICLSQRFDAQTLPVSAREQFNLCFQLGNISSKTTQFLFPDFSPNGLVIPAGTGTGLVQIIDGERTANILPVLTPSLKKGA